MLPLHISEQLKQYIHDYLDNCRYRNMSPGTIEGYRCNLKQFIGLLHLRPNSAHVTEFAEICTEPVMIETVILKTEQNPDLTAYTIRRYVCAWRGLVCYLVKTKVLDLSYDRFEFELPKLPEALPKAVNMKELEGLLDYGLTHHDNPNWIDWRNLCIFELMAYSGLRISEATGLTVNDVFLSQNQIRVTGKGNRTRLVPITDCAVDRIRNYLKARSKANIKIKSNHLFISRQGNGIGNSTIRMHLKKWAKQSMGAAQRMTPHMLRHSCATHFVKKTHNLRFVQILLGHKNISTTQVYTHLDNDFVNTLFHDNHDRKTGE